MARPEFPGPSETLFENVFIRKSTPLISPREVKTRYPASEKSLHTVLEGREAVRAALKQDSNSKLFVITGPCSIHSVEQALRFAGFVREQREEYDELEILMRAFFEKSRTTIGWEGLISDPDLDRTYNFNKGLLIARKLVCDITNLGIPIGTELLDSITPDYYAGLMSWGAIGARTTQSPLHRHIGSGISFPLGFKNGTEGNINIAVDAVKTVSHPHHFPGTTEEGMTAVYETIGKTDCHIVLRGGASSSNYDPKSVAFAIEELKKRDLPPVLAIDFSHGNSNKDYKRQKIVAESVAEQIAAGNTSIVGAMMESNLVEGS